MVLAGFTHIDDQEWSQEAEQQKGSHPYVPIRHKREDMENGERLTGYKTGQQISISVHQDVASPRVENLGKDLKERAEALRDLSRRGAEGDRRVFRTEIRSIQR